MWRNEVVVDLIEWLKAHNEGIATRQAQGEMLSQA
jgi:erythromycin esterase-like protein